jgi:hypothetical protein
MVNVNIPLGLLRRENLANVIIIVKLAIAPFIPCLILPIIDALKNK